MAYAEVDDETYEASEAQDAGTYPGVAEQFFPEEEPAGVVTPVGAEEPSEPPNSVYISPSFRSANPISPEDENEVLNTPAVARAPSDQQDAPRTNVSGQPTWFSRRQVPGPSMPAHEPEILSPQQLVQMLDSGFDKLIESARAKQPGEARAPARQPMPILRNWGPLTREQVLQSYGGVIGKGEEAGVLETLRGLPETPAAPTARVAGAHTAMSGQPPAPTTGSEASVRTPEYLQEYPLFDESGSPYVGGPVGERPAPPAAPRAAPAPAPAPAAAAPAPSGPGLPRSMRADGSMGVVPTAQEMRQSQQRPQARRQRQEETPLQSAIREANLLFPWASQEGTRAAYVAQRMGEEFKRGTTWGTEDIRGQRAHATEIARANIAERGAASRERIAADRNEAAATRAAARETAAYERQQAKIAADAEKSRAADEARMERLRAQQEAIAQREMMKAELSTLARQNATFGRLMGEHLRADPSLAQNPFELLKRMGPSMKQMGIDTDAVRSRVLIAPTGGGGERGGGGARKVPSSVDAAAERNLTPGQVVPREYNGEIYNYIVGPDGNLYEENEYKRRGMGR